MYFDFEGRNFDTPTVESAVSWREQALVSVFGHIVFVLLVLFVPRLEFFEKLQEQHLERLAELAEQRQQQQLALAERERDRESFVFIAPGVEPEVPETPRPGAPLSDLDRLAQSPLSTPDPANRLPVAEGTTSEFAVLDNPDEDPDLLAPRDLEGVSEDSEVEEVVPEPEDDDEDDLGEGRLADATVGHGEEEEVSEAPSDTPGVPDEDFPGSERLADTSLTQPGAGPGDPDDARSAPDQRADGLLADASRTLERSLQRQTFGNVSGDTGRYGQDIRFDSKGVDFGSWLRRFRAQIYRNWVIPLRAWTDSGHVVLTFNIHRDGTMTDLGVLQPSRVDPFNHSASNALRMSNPTQPLPTEYPDEKVLFTVTFYFNEYPPGR
jgi:TonB family protein